MGSSRTRKLASAAASRASAVRHRSPPLSWATRCKAVSPVSPKRASRSRRCWSLNCLCAGRMASRAVFSSSRAANC